MLLADRVWQAVEASGEACHRSGSRPRVPYDVLMGITRGGLIPCALLSQRFELRSILTASVFFYDDRGETFYGLTEPRTLTFPDAQLIEGKRVLVVDDVFDTGRTARAVRTRCERAGARSVDVAVLHYKPDNNRFGDAEAPRYFAQQVAGSEWIVYPWENLSPAGIERRLASPGPDA
ncbi:hypothetical protein CDCA_CDCA07G2223 [Cyanidium caldarium]|uniref:Phosphoribosyltransferase domain-containing protein n=1 Tax=Cyanidium caldarium TaxID=2771 RepID=A0AAV9IVU4_CYACA|nr:hypothetical protein CDCA_CDCA07G2223 [Cyanidium caldarium]